MSEDAAAYRVLARKYRPASFAGLIGQDPLVRTLSNAIAMDRLAHAYLLTGVRGVGKTSTARIIARALNCIGEDGTGGPTPDPCGTCDHCVSIAEDRHVDVIEMDAASRTGIDDVRELIESVRYRPVSARYKVYIIDEVHMLSKQAFNALLKTLEEPPPHVKFVFATTEVRRLPVTVLSRCQRFDLRRVDMEVLDRALLADRGRRGCRGGARGARAHRPRRRRLGAGRALRARPGDGPRGHAHHRRGGAGHAGARGPDPALRPLRYADEGRDQGRAGLLLRASRCGCGAPGVAAGPAGALPLADPAEACARRSGRPRGARGGTHARARHGRGVDGAVAYPDVADAAERS